MALRVINVGTVIDDGTGDQPRNAFIKVNDNFAEVAFKDTVEPYTKAQYFAAAASTVATSTHSWDTETQQVLALTITEDVEIEIGNVHAGCTYIIILIQDGTGGWAVSWATNLNIFWADGTVPVVDTAPGGVSIITFVSYGDDVYGSGITLFA